MPFELPPLPYDYSALEPHIDAQTMQIHHDKHHQAYVDKANAALEGTEWADKDVEEVLRNLDQVPEDKRAAVSTVTSWRHTRSGSIPSTRSAWSFSRVLRPATFQETRSTA